LTLLQHDNGDTGQITGVGKLTMSVCCFQCYVLWPVYTSTHFPSRREQEAEWACVSLRGWLHIKTVYPRAVIHPTTKMT